MLLTENKLRRLIESILLEVTRYDNKAIEIAQALSVVAPGLLLDIPVMVDGMTNDDLAASDWDFVHIESGKRQSFKPYTVKKAKGTDPIK